LANRDQGRYQAPERAGEFSARGVSHHLMGARFSFQEAAQQASENELSGRRPRFSLAAVIRAAGYKEARQSAWRQKCKEQKQ
jgi:hypothetical protein